MALVVLFKGLLEYVQGFFAMIKELFAKLGGLKPTEDPKGSGEQKENEEKKDGE